MKITSASNHCSCDSIRELVELVWLKLVIVRGGACSFTTFSGILIGEASPSVDEPEALQEAVC